MISADDIDALCPPVPLPTTDGMLGFSKVFKALEAYIDTGTKASIGYARKWNVTLGNCTGTWGI